MNNNNNIAANALKLVVKAAQLSKQTQQAQISQQSAQQTGKDQAQTSKASSANTSIPTNTQGNDSGAPKTHTSALKTSLFAMNYGDEGDSFGGNAGGQGGKQR